MKRLSIILSLLIAFTIFAVVVISSPSDILYLINWGEYINQDLVKQFEKENNCQVIEEDVTSSEARYQKIVSGATSYDVAIPGDYTVEQLYNEGYLLERDVENKELKNLCSYRTMFADSLSSLRDEYPVKRSYYMPYFYGSYSILYSTKKDYVEKSIKENGFKTLFNRSLFEGNVKVGRYDTSRWMVASYLLNKGLDPNVTDLSTLSSEGNLSKDLEQEIISALKKEQFDEFGNDQLKRDIASGSLDLCFVQSGDFFDALYLSLSQSDKDIEFNISVPKISAAFFDSMVIPKTCQNKTLANRFINFMLDSEHAYQNALAIGYSPTVKEVCSLFEKAALEGEDYYKDDHKSLSRKEFLSKYPYYLNPLYQVEKAYRLKPKSSSYLTTCETIFNHLA